MPTRTLETRQDCEDFVRGCALLATGGGGQVEDGIESLLQELEAGRSPGWVDVEEIEDDDWTACPFLMGSMGTPTPEMERDMLGFGLTEVKVKEGLKVALEELASYRGITLSAVVPVELGGANAPLGMVAAAHMGLATVDGDYVGRAIPEIDMLAPSLFDKPLTPIAGVDKWGDITILKEALNVPMTERIGKLLSVAAFGIITMAGIALKASEVKEILVRGTLTRCLELGRSIRNARETGDDPVEAARAFLDGWVVFKGEVVEKAWEDRDGYYWGTHALEGVEGFAGKTFKVWFKNENHVSWLDGLPYVTSPDIIALVDLKTGEPITNNRVAEGNVMAVLGAKAPRIYRENKKGIELLSPSHFGFGDIQHKPIEEVMRSS